jgi:hypothetical protein
MSFRYFFRQINSKSFFRLRPSYSLLNSFTTEKRYNYMGGRLLFGSLGACILLANSTSESDSRGNLPRNFVSDAAEKASPSVVNILCPVQGVMVSGVSTGSGFIISKV